VGLVHVDERGADKLGWETFDFDRRWRLVISNPTEGVSWTHELVQLLHVDGYLRDTAWQHAD
jgi:hypothetical protein